MTQPQQGEQRISSELGWKRLTHTLAKTMPQRLTWSSRNRSAIRTMMKPMRK